jgi:hypothetical protein
LHVRALVTVWILVACRGSPPPAEPPLPLPSPELPKQTADTMTMLAELHATAERWRAAHPSESSDCPTLASLEQDKQYDVWGGRFRIVCDHDETIILSDGPDRREGTEDDLRYPSATALRTAPTLPRPLPKCRCRQGDPLCSETPGQTCVGASK